MSLPDEFVILINGSDAMVRYRVRFPGLIDELKAEMVVRSKQYVVKIHHEYIVFQAVVISDLESMRGEILIPANPIENFLNGFHGC